ncbi:hypothetical protein [Pseudoalteromonas rubra]|uniref:Uncharacterized protein n=1 Tax=Pseudoalteromonas rubra TaxID=43658 RepID=A0A0F4QJX8_9GAMM|nr:hypothetical protein [Pseudoalteromonas rubra]KJZ06962.1 hypothetical protein TW77_17255 [Pseudoalteromonas rubra]
MKEFILIAEYLPLAMIFVALIFSWRVVTARWFLLAFMAIELVDIALRPIIWEWKTHYYIVDIIVTFVFIMPIVYRRNVALKLFNLTGHVYFSKVYELQRLTSQECLILILLAIGCLTNLIAWLEVLAYKYYFIDTAPFKLYFRDNIMLVLHVLYSMALLTYTVKAEQREDYVRNENTTK